MVSAQEVTKSLMSADNLNRLFRFRCNSVLKKTNFMCKMMISWLAYHDDWLFSSSPSDAIYVLGGSIKRTVV